MNINIDLLKIQSKFKEASKTPSATGYAPLLNTFIHLFSDDRKGVVISNKKNPQAPYYILRISSQEICLQEQPQNALFSYHFPTNMFNKQPLQTQLKPLQCFSEKLIAIMEDVKQNKAQILEVKKK